MSTDDIAMTPSTAETPQTAETPRMVTAALAAPRRPASGASARRRVRWVRPGVSGAVLTSALSTIAIEAIVVAVALRLF